MEQSDLDNLLKQIKKERVDNNIQGEINPYVIIDESQTEQRVNDFDLHTGYNFDISGQFIDLILIGNLDTDVIVSILEDKGIFVSDYNVELTIPSDAYIEKPLLECPYTLYLLLKKKDPQDIIEPLIADVEPNLSLDRYANGNPYAQRSLE